MRTEFAFRNPDELLVTLTVTAPLGEFRALRKQMAQEWPSYEMSRQIGDVIRAAEEKFTAHSPEPDNG